jgi:hypothetical protein
VTSSKYGNVAVLELFSAVCTAVQSLLIVVISADVMFDEVTAAASASYAALRSFICCVVSDVDEDEDDGVYRPSNWLKSVGLSLRVVPGVVSAVTRLFSNDASAEWLLSVRPSLARVWKSCRIVASSPIVVPDLLSIVRMSLRSV